VPIIHTEADMGSMAEPLKREFIHKFGRAKWKRHVEAVDDFWAGIRWKIGEIRLDPRRLRIYQDGLPICGRELEIFREVSRLGSKNHRIVLELIERGAKLEGTEDPKYLVEEYMFVKQLTGISDPQEKKKAIEKARPNRDGLLVKRDQFIAKRIGETLRPGEKGLLFCGIEHRIDKYLPRKIEVSYLIYRLPFRSLTRPQ
jgi:hypothetical protein